MSDPWSGENCNVLFRPFLTPTFVWFQQACMRSLGCCHPEVYRSSAELQGLAEPKENTTRHGDTDELFSAVLYLFNRSSLTAKFTVRLKVQTLAPYIGTCPCPNLEVTCVTDSWMCWVREWMVHDNNGVSNSCFTVGRRNQIHPPCFTTWSS